MRPAANAAYLPEFVKHSGRRYQSALVPVARTIGAR